MQLIFDLKKKFKFRVQNGSWGAYKSLIVKENTIHQLDTNNSVQLIIYVDSESDIARAIKLRYLQQNDLFSPDKDILNCLKPGQLEQCLIEPNMELLERSVHQLLNQLVDDKRPIRIDERVKEVINILAVEYSEETTTKFLSERVFLSESRLRTLFKANMGVSLHRYIIWNKIVIAISKIMNGATIGEAAISCGFSDSSHFHKMVLLMFGISPSQFIRNNNQKNIYRSDQAPLSVVTSLYNERFWNIERVNVR